MKYYECPICQTQIMYEFAGKKQENAGQRIRKHVQRHALSEVAEFLEMAIVNNFFDATNANQEKSIPKSK